MMTTVLVMMASTTTPATFFTSRLFFFFLPLLFFLPFLPLDLGQEEVVESFLSGTNVAKAFKDDGVMTVLQKNQVLNITFVTFGKSRRNSPKEG